MSIGVSAPRHRRSVVCNGSVSSPANPIAVGLFGELTLPPTESTTAFPAAISKFYDKSAAATAFNLTWELSVNNGAWIRLITTYHQLYLTKNDPALVASAGSCADPLPGNLETAFYLACNLSNGKTLDDDIVTSIYNEFTDRRVYGVHKITGDPAGVPLNYYGPTPRPEFLGRTGHLLTKGYGACRGWADFFKQIISIHGIAASTIQLTVASGNSPNLEANGASRAGGVFVLKPIVIPVGGAEQTIVSPNPSFYQTSLGLPIKIPAQGGLNEYQFWDQHAITKSNGRYFDPSYGTSSAGPLGGLSAEQQFTLGLAGYRGVRTNMFNTQFDRWWNVDSINLELDFTPVP